MVPAAIASPFTAVLADRFPRQRVMIASDLLRAAMIGSAAASVWLAAPAWVVFALASLVALAVATLYPGDYVGEIALLRGLPRVATVLARDPVEAFTLEREKFLAAVTGYAPSARAAEAIAGARLAGLQGSRVMGVRGV